MKTVLLLLATLLVLPAFAEEAEFSGGEHPCRADREKFCKDIKPGGGAVVRCMAENKEKFSSECRAKMTEHQSKMMERKSKRRESRQELMEKCRDDAQKLCKDVKPGGGAKMECLKKNETALSESCKQALSESK